MCIFIREFMRCGFFLNTPRFQLTSTLWFLILLNSFFLIFSSCTFMISFVSSFFFSTFLVYWSCFLSLFFFWIDTQRDLLGFHWPFCHVRIYNTHFHVCTHTLYRHTHFLPYFIHLASLICFPAVCVFIKYFPDSAAPWQHSQRYYS